jgi:hypothetical protein
MSTQDQTLSSTLHGEALLVAKRPELHPLIDHLRDVEQDRDDIRTECAGVIAASWFANPARRGEELIAASLLMLAARPTSTRRTDGCLGWDRRPGAMVPQPDSDD